MNPDYYINSNNYEYNLSHGGALKKCDPLPNFINPNTKDNFQVIDKLGEGTFGKVWSLGKCGNDDIVKENDYIVKEINTNKEKMIPLIEREVAFLHMLSTDPKQETYLIGNKEVKLVPSNFIITFNGCVKKDNGKNYFILQEACHGGELFNYIVPPDEPVLPAEKKSYFEMNEIDKLETAKAIMMQLFIGVKYIHDKGIIHKDLKPENILLKYVNDPTNLRIIDFGLSEWVDITQTITSGSPSYMAPEVLNLALDTNGKKEYSSICDIWSLGIILYELLVDDTPYLEDEIIERESTYLRDEYIYMTNDQQRHKQDADFKALDGNSKDLINRLLDPKQETRITLEEALHHPWFNDFISKEDGLAKEIIDNNKIRSEMANATTKFCEDIDSKTEDRSNNHLPNKKKKIKRRNRFIFKWKWGSDKRFFSRWRRSKDTDVKEEPKGEWVEIPIP